jgi:hypothetical protein
MTKLGMLTGIEFDDEEGLVQWARGMCSGQTVEQWAQLAEVEPTVKAVSAYIGRDLPEKAHRIVIETCQAELRKSGG